MMAGIMPFFRLFEIHYSWFYYEETTKGFLKSEMVWNIPGNGNCRNPKLADYIWVFNKMPLKFWSKLCFTKTLKNLKLL